MMIKCVHICIPVVCITFILWATIFREDYRKSVPFTASIKVYHYHVMLVYKILQCYVSVCKHIIFVEQIKREDNKVSFELLIMKINQILI